MKMKFQLKRLIFQISLLISANLGAIGLKTGFCYPFFYCHACPAATSACPLRALEQSVFKGSLTWKFLIYPLLIIGFFGILTGRAICGWACPIGLLQRGTGHVARKLKTKPHFSKITFPKLDHYLRYTKYVILIGLVFAASILIGIMFTDFCPIGFLTGTIPLVILNPGKFVGNDFFLIALIIFILFLLLIILIERGWCRYFCPLGALFAPFNKISFLHINVDKEDCIECNACSKTCPMGINVPEMHRDPECILCGKCVSTCPKNLIQYRKV